MTHDSRLERVDADALALSSCLFEPNLSVNQSEQGVIASYSYVAARPNDGAALAHEDRASPHDRAVATFDAQPLALAIATVARATDAFLVCPGFLCAFCLSGLGMFGCFFVGWRPGLAR